MGGLPIAHPATVSADDPVPSAAPVGDVATTCPSGAGLPELSTSSTRAKVRIKPQIGVEPDAQFFHLVACRHTTANDHARPHPCVRTPSAARLHIHLKALPSGRISEAPVRRRVGCQPSILGERQAGPAMHQASHRAATWAAPMAASRPQHFVQRKTAATSSLVRLVGDKSPIVHEPSQFWSSISRQTRVHGPNVLIASSNARLTAPID